MSERAPSRPLCSQGGSSLIEIVVAGAIFAFLVLSLTNSILNTRKAAVLSADASVAVTLAQDELEALRNLASTASDLRAGSHSDPLNPLNPNGATGGIYTRTWTVTDDSPVSGMKRIEMRVSWNDRVGPSAVTLVTLAIS